VSSNGTKNWDRPCYSHPKLKVGGSGDPIEHLARIKFFVTEDTLALATDLEEAGHAHFYADRDPHVTRLVLCQD